MAIKQSCQCPTCKKFGLLQPESNFYSVQHDLFKKYPVCKSCISEKIDLNNHKDVLFILQQLDFPYLEQTWDDLLEKYPDSALGRYLLEIRRNETTKKMRFSDTNTMPEKYTGLIELKIETDEMKALFGEEFSQKELIAMQKKYEFLKTSYDEITSMHTESLINYVRLKVKEEFAIATDEVDAAKKWGSMASSAATAAGINPSQLKKADLIGGITTFSELTQVIENHTGGVIPIMPEFLQRPRDVPDFTIWNYIDTARHLEGKDPVTYREVYKFYDKRKADFIKENDDGKKIFENDKPEEYRPMVEDFMKMPKDVSENQIGELDG